MITTDGIALLRSICEDPSSDDVRLIYADWLEEGNSRHSRWFTEGHAALIRAMVPRPECGVLLRRYRPQLRPKKIGGRFTLPPEAWQVAGILHLRDDAPDVPLTEVVVRRGFVDEVRLPLAAWLEHGAGLVASHPVTRVRVSDRQPTPDGGWRRSPRASLGAPHLCLPPAIFDLMPGVVRYHRRTGSIGYGTTERAEAAISTALVSHARRLAGLPDLLNTEGAG